MINPIQNTNIQDSNVQNNLNELRRLNCKEQSSDDKLWEAAKGFEAIFVTRLLEQMNDSEMGKGGFLGRSNGEKMYKSMFFQEIGKEIVKNPTASFGMANAVYNRLKNTGQQG
ncbi:MAG: rod-binding protein [Candidatus Gastranaerophilales bacterium]|nr:rod-binding protein [Candidatus Gastranaerophilales bacterium]